MVIELHIVPDPLCFCAIHPASGCMSGSTGSSLYRILHLRGCTLRKQPADVGEIIFANDCHFLVCKDGANREQ